jgi:hypothetical protein
MTKPEPFQIPLPLTLDDAIVVIEQLQGLIDQLNAGNAALMKALDEAIKARPVAGPLSDG